MLTQAENERLTQVGRGTPTGELLRRYWWPVASHHELRQNPVKAVRVLGESLTLFCDRQGRLGLVAERCAHRGVNLRHGIPENEGLRCPYHGWMYDTSGQCVDQPAESPGSTFKDKVKIASYPVDEMGGLIWAYLGPSPAPVLPAWDVFVDEAYRIIGTTVLPCNWVQSQENAVDTVHNEYLHGHWGVYTLERLGTTDPAVWRRFQGMKESRNVKIRFQDIPYGIQKFRLRAGQSEADSEDWNFGHPMVFPNMVLIGTPGAKEMQIRVPMDDYTTWHLSYQVFFPGPGQPVPRQDPIPSFEVPVVDLPDWILGQDLAVWASQGAVADRTTERLAESDRGVIRFRKMLDEQAKVVEDSGDPMNVFRHADAAKRVALEMEHDPPLRRHQPGYLRHSNAGPLNPVMDELDAFRVGTVRAWERQAAAGQQANFPTP